MASGSRLHHPPPTRSSTAQLAARLGVRNMAVVRWEAGRNRPRARVLRRLAMLFDLPYDVLAALAAYSIDPDD